MSKYDWRFENSIMNGKKVSIDPDYNQWRTNLALANHKDTILFVNEINQYSVTDQMHYDYLHGAIRKTKRKYQKATSKNQQYDQETISLICEYYKYNLRRAKEVMCILSPEQISVIRRKLNQGGET